MEPGAFKTRGPGWREISLQKQRAAYRRPRGEQKRLGLLLDAQILEALLELGELAAAVHQAMNAGPGRMRLGIDLEIERVAGLAPGRARLEGRSVGHHDVDLMVFGMDLLFHRRLP